jgi:hypothetical protein
MSQAKKPIDRVQRMSEAQKVEEAMMKMEGYRDGSFMEAMKFITDCQVRRHQHPTTRYCQVFDRR